VHEVELGEQRLDPRAQAPDAVEEAEDAEVLGDGEVPRERRVDGGEVGALQRLAALRGEVEPVDADVGESTPRIMSMVVVLPAPFGPRSPTISPGATRNDTPSTARRSP
jgi:hypothetical protein